MENRNDAPLIRTVGLKKYFHVPQGELHAVDDLNLTIERGKTLGIVGESGCGKSTLGRCILRLHEPTAGEVIFEDRNILECSKAEMKELRSKMQIIFQDPYASLNPRMTVSQAIAAPLIIQGIYKPSEKEKIRKRVAEMMDVVGLAPRLVNSYPHELDGGRRQRIGIARALSVNPKFIVCDEPVSALDVSIQAQIINLFSHLRQEHGFSILFIAHDLSMVEYLCDRVGVMYRGKLVELGPTETVFAHPRHDYTKALLSAIPLPDPIRERQRRRLDFDTMTFRRDGVMGEVEPGHFVLTGEEDGQ